MTLTPVAARPGPQPDRSNPPEPADLPAQPGPVIPAPSALGRSTGGRPLTRSTRRPAGFEHHAPPSGDVIRPAGIGRARSAEPSPHRCSDHEPGPALAVRLGRRASRPSSLGGDGALRWLVGAEPNPSPQGPRRAPPICTHFRPRADPFGRQTSPSLPVSPTYEPASPTLHPRLSPRRAHRSPHRPRCPCESTMPDNDRPMIPFSPQRQGRSRRLGLSTPSIGADDSVPDRSSSPIHSPRPPRRGGSGPSPSRSDGRRARTRPQPARLPPRSS